jgi:predicted GIY-YIG superfamily endonuclease
MRGGWTYIMTNRPRGVLYIGVTADLAARVTRHRAGAGSAFCQRYHLTASSSPSRTTRSKTPSGAKSFSRPGNEPGKSP